MKKRILFVDDERSLLDGLRRALRGQRQEWQMAFALSGQEALTLVEAEHFDAVVTDMRMPGMNGVQLLEALVQHHPDLIRIVLSGHSDQEMSMRSVELAHQYLAKPCDIDTLKMVLIRAFTLKQELANESIQALVAGMTSLPSLPAVFKEINERLQSPNVSTHEVGEIIARDPAMTAKILQMVNSAFFGIGRHISNPADASTLLGLKILKSLILSVGIFSQFDSAQFRVKGFSIDRLWQHSLAVASLAEKIAQAEGAEKEFVEDCLVAGLLHDVGKLVLARNFPVEFTRVHSPETECHKPMEVPILEHEIFGATHGAVGAYLLGLWGIADAVVEAVAFHQRPMACPHKAFTPLVVVTIANALVKTEPGQALSALEPYLNFDYLRELGLEDRLEGWMALHTASRVEED